VTSSEWINDALNNALQAAQGVIFADGSRPAGTDPARIYAWFHNGPGTGSYSSANANLSALSSTYPDYTDQLKAAQREISDGWQGSAADSAVNSFNPTLQNAATLTHHASTANKALTDQITSFADTRNKVISVASQPPKGPGMNQFVNPLAPDNYTADAAVAAYQIGTHNNQDAYGSYQGQTSHHAAALPQDDKKGSGNPPPGDNTPPPNDTPPPPGDNPPTGTQPPADQQPTSPTSRQQNNPGQGPQKLPGSTPGHPTQPGSGHSQTGTSPGDSSSTSSPTDATTSSSYQPPSTVPGSSFGDTGYGGLNGQGGSGRGGSSTPGTGSGAWGSMATGGSVSGGLGAGGQPGSGAGSTRPGSAGAGSAGSAAGRTTSSQGMPGMGGQGKGKGEDDAEHRGRGLVKQDWDAELIGDLPPHVPSVIECGPDGYDDYED